MKNKECHEVHINIIIFKYKRYVNQICLNLFINKNYVVLCEIKLKQVVANILNNYRHHKLKLIYITHISIFCKSYTKDTKIVNKLTFYS